MSCNAFKEMGGHILLPALLAIGLVVALALPASMSLAQDAERSKEGLDDPFAEVELAPIEEADAAELASDEEAANAEEAEEGEVVVMEVEEAPILGLDFGARASPEMTYLQRYAQIQSSFAQRVCDFDERQLRELEEMDQAWLEAELEKTQVMPIRGVAAGIARFLGNRVPQARQGRQPTESIPIVIRAVDERILEVCNSEQRAVYQEERDHYRKFRQEALAETILAVLDRRLYLTDEQRQAMLPIIKDALGERDLYWQFYFQNTQYIPAMSHLRLATVLESSQMLALKGYRAWTYDSLQFEIQNLEQLVPAIAQ